MIRVSPPSFTDQSTPRLSHNPHAVARVEYSSERVLRPTKSLSDKRAVRLPAGKSFHLLRARVLPDSMLSGSAGFQTA